MHSYPDGNPSIRTITKPGTNCGLRFFNFGRQSRQWKLDEVTSYSRKRVEIPMDARLIHLIPETMFVQYLTLITR
jgi:hypothetical protein